METYIQFWWFLFTLLQYLPLLNDTVPVPQLKGDYGIIILSPVVPLLDQSSRQELGKEPLRSQFPLTYEQLGQRYGFMLYETIVAHSSPDPALFSIPNISDRAIVLLDDVSYETIFFILHYCHCCCCCCYIYIYIHTHTHMRVLTHTHTYILREHLVFLYSLISILKMHWSEASWLFLYCHFRSEYFTWEMRILDHRLMRMLYNTITDAHKK